MSTKKTIAKSFTVSTIEDGVSVQAQYAPNANPTSGQIHTVWQNGDLYMRTRESDESAWSSWHKIVGESGDETDYTFGISQYRTTENAQTAPSDISSWSDAPLAVTTAKPYLWSKVQQKSWNESTQQYVVDSTRHIRLTGEEGVVYDIQTPVDSIHIGENQTSATLSGTAKFYKKEGTKDKVQTVFYYGIYKRAGTTFEKVATGNANSYTFNALSVANTVNAIVIYLFASSYTGTSPETQTYLVKREMMVVDAGNSPYFADLDNEMDSIACTNAGKPSSEQTVETNVKLYRGSTALSPTLAVNDDSPSGAAYTSGTAKDGITVTWNNTTGNIKFKFGTSNSRTKTETFCITLTVTDNGATITRYLYFTVNCIRAALDGNPSALYRLTPSVNEIVKKKDGTYVPTGNTYITCGVTKNVGGTQSTPSAIEYTLKYSLNGEAETTYTATSVKANQVTSNLVFILYVNSVVVDRETIGLVTDGIDGTSPYFADLDNEMDSIACTHDGKAASAQSVVTHVSMFKGSSAEAFTVDKIYRNGTQMSWDGNNNGVWPRLSGGTVTLEFDSGAAVNVKDDFKITLYATNATSVTRELHFIVNGVRANAIYRLVPSHSQIVKKKDGTYVPSGNVTCSVEKTENGSTSTPSSSEYTLEKSVNGGSYTTYSATAASSITSDLKFRLKVGGVEVDLETIPLVSDGNKGDTGDSAPVAYATPEKITIPCNTDGSVASQITQFIKFGMRVGSNDATSIRVDNPTSTPTGVSWSATQANQGNLTISTSASASGMANGVTFKVTGTYGGKDYVSYATVALLGTQKGNTGDSAPVAFANPDKITIPCGISGYVSSALTQGVTFSLKVGTNAATVTGVTSGIKPTGVTVTGQAANVVTIKVGTSATASGLSSGVTFTVTGTYDGKTYSATVTVALIGSIQGEQGGTGARGKIGRFFYYAGAWNDFASTDSFLVNDAQAPYFYYNNNYWVFNPETNGTYTKLSMGTPAASSPNWTMMYNEFKYIITEAIFGKYAHFGSFIINVDWMLSQHGTLVSSGGTEIIVDETNQDVQYNNGVTTIVLNGNGVNNGVIVCQVSFTADTNTQVSITITPSSESSYDFGAVGELDSDELKDATAANIKNDTVTSLIKASGTTAVSTTVNVSAGTHFFYIAYAKDRTTAGGNDNATFSFGSLTYSSDLVKKNDGMTYTFPKWGVAYTWFDSDDPLAKTLPNTGYKFIPNFAVDALTGSSYQNDGTFRGIVTANLSYSPTGTKTGNDDVTLNPSSDKCGTFLISGITTAKNIYLPLASQYDGLEYNLIQAVYVNDEYKNCNINRSGSEQIYVPTNNKLTAVTAFTLPPNIIVKLKAISGSWYVVQGLT